MFNYFSKWKFENCFWIRESDYEHINFQLKLSLNQGKRFWMGFVTLYPAS